MRKLKKLESKLHRIGIYVRVSTEEQAENPEGSIKNQEQRLREFVRLKNTGEPYGEVVAVYSDPGISAKNMNRPGFQKMLQAIEKGEIDMVLVTELSRFSRSTKDFTMLQEFLEERGCKFMSLRENFDTSGAAGSMVLNMMASIAEFERRQTGERVAHSFLASAKRGLYNGGSVLLGYRIDKDRPGHLVVDSERAEIVRFAFKSFLRIGTLAETTKFLNSKKIELPKKVDGGGGVRSNKFTLETLYRLLRNRAYIGVRVYRTKNGTEEVPAVWEPIVDRDTFDRANRSLKKNCSRKRTHADKRYPYTLSGLVFCSQCENTMSGKSAHGCSGKVGYYEHGKHARFQAETYQRLHIHEPHRIPSAKLEPLVWQEVKRFVTSEAFAKSLLERARAGHERMRQTDDSQRLKKLVLVTAGQIELLAERIAMLPREMDPKPLLDQLSRLQQTKVDQEKELVDSESKVPNQDEPVRFDDLKIFRKDLRGLLAKADINKDIQAAVIRRVVHKITIQPDGFEIYFHIGHSHYVRELGKIPSSRAFLSAMQKSRKVVSSTLLTNGDHGKD